MKIDDINNLKTGDNITSLTGWIDTVRHHGGLLFFELRDYKSKIQVVTDMPDKFEELKNEFYVSIDGILSNREEQNINQDSDFGSYEIKLLKLDIISKSKTLPFQIEDHIDVDEVIRLKYRYLDLRRDAMNSNILYRSNTFKAIREFMSINSINEIDTPTLIKSTPEGAKDFIVPSRKSPGKFYALPQSPQMYKQLFMLSGFENYYQIAKCYRDEDSRKDRQPEFTQLDLELSNATPEQVMKLIENTVKYVLAQVYGLNINNDFERLSYNDSIQKYGTDKPDLRIEKTIQDFTDIFINTEISFIKDTIDNGGFVRGFIIEKILSRSEIDKLDEAIKELGSPGLGWFKIENNNISGPLSKVLNKDELSAILKYPDSTMLFQAGSIEEFSPSLDYIRRNLYLPSSTSDFIFLWVDDFPYFHNEDGELQPSHHPFTSPVDKTEFLNDPKNARALHYDLVLNGVELGSGSQRVNDPDLQKKIFQKWGLSEQEINDRFGWFLEALSYGSPQHAGFAIGIDRFVTEMVSADSIRDVIPFPKTQSGLDPLTDAPTSLNKQELLEYNIEIQKEGDE